MQLLKHKAKEETTHVCWKKEQHDEKKPQIKDDNARTMKESNE
jgi:hypothetical protein